jgi:hypothetical protein
MAYTATYQATLTVLGSGLGSAGAPYLQDSQQTQPTSQNTAPPGKVTLAVGANTIALPASALGYAFTKVVLMPPGASSNNKYITTSGGTRVIPSAVANFWTTGSITLPAGPGDTIYVNSNAAEDLILGYA